MDLIGGAEIMDKVVKIRFKKYKSFSDKAYSEFEIKRNVNLFIGKNNSGKSSCLDIVEAVFDSSYYTNHSRDIDSLEIAFELDEERLSLGFSKTQSSSYTGMSYYSYGTRYIGKRVYFTKEKQSLSFLKEQPEIEYQKKVTECFAKLARVYGDYHKEYIFRRVDAERDILAEPESHYENVFSNGSGATNLVRMFITHSRYEESIVEKTLLNELNHIMAPDSIFTNIKVQQVEQNGTLYWEIFLEEKDAGRFALSKSGSGLKTILLVLINLYLIPELETFKGKK